MKEPNVAGAFYPGRSRELALELDDYLKKAPAGKEKIKPKAIIVPHAGYIYSGATAAYAYKLLERQKYTAAVIMAPSHYFWLQGAAIYPEGSFKTPLGEVPVAAELAGVISRESGVQINTAVFEREHSLEVQIPFLQTVLKDLRLVPMIIGQYSLEVLQQLKAALLSPVKTQDLLLVASTDLAHFHPAERNDKMDEKALSFLVQNDLSGLLKSTAKAECELCGLGPVAVTMLLAAELGWKFNLLKHSNSGEANGDYDRVVGYAAGYYA